MLFIISLGDPGGGECAKGREGGGTFPYSELTVSGSDDFHLSAWWGELGELRFKSISETSVHGGTTREDNVLAEILSNINIRSLNRLPGEFVEGSASHTGKGWLEEEFWAAHSHNTTNVDDSLIWKGVWFVILRGALSSLGFLIEVLSDVAKFFFNVLDDFFLGRGGEVLSSVVNEELLKPLSKNSSSDFHLLDSVWNRETFENWDSVGNTITRVDYETCGSSCGVEGHDSLNGDVAVWNLEGLEHDGSHLFSVCLWVSWGLSKKNTSEFSWVASELIVEGVLPDLFHIFPGLNDTGGNWVVELKDTSLLVGFLTNVFRFLVNTLHGRSVLGSSDDGWEDASWGFFTGKTGLDHTGSVVNDDSLCFTHLKVVCLQYLL